MFHKHLRILELPGSEDTRQLIQCILFSRCWSKKIVPISLRSYFKLLLTKIDETSKDLTFSLKHKHSNVIHWNNRKILTNPSMSVNNAYISTRAFRQRYFGVSMIATKVISKYDAFTSTRTTFPSYLHAPHVAPCPFNLLHNPQSFTRNANTVERYFIEFVILRVFEIRCWREVNVTNNYW